MTVSRTLLTVLLSLLLTGAGMSFADDRVLTILAPEVPGSSEWPGVGRDADLVSATLYECGYRTEFIIQPFGRHMLSYRQSDVVDAVMTVPLSSKLPGHPTSAYVWYQNGAYYDTGRIPAINSVNDLEGLDIVTFHDGIRILGLTDMVDDLGEIHEKADQTIHSDLLFLGRVDVILADGLIVAEVNERIRQSGKLPDHMVRESEFRFAPIFDPTPYKMVFREAALAQSFDECFDRLYRDGTITRILDQYLIPHQKELQYRYVAQ